MKGCIALRHAHPALRTGKYRTLWAEPASRLYAFARWNDEQQVVVVLNPHDAPASINLPLRDDPVPTATRLRDLLTDRVYPVQQGYVEAIQVGAYSGAVLVRA